jgi:hypothetical protein
LEFWEFIHSYAHVHDTWRWRRRDSGHQVLRESPPFSLFMQCVAHAREQGFDLTGHNFHIVEE